MENRYFICELCWEQRHILDQLIELPGVCSYCLEDAEHASQSTPSTGDATSGRER
jgi:transcription initiation factor IIE alpha subunit